MIDLRAVEKRWATGGVGPVTLTVERGETLAILGTSGCGKSTLLRLVVGLVLPDAGDVTIGGVRMEPRSAQALRRRMGYVIQEGGLFPHLSTRDNVALLARHLGWETPRIEERLRALLSLVKLPATTLDALPAELSGGQRQRVSLMRALMLEPEVLLLDEPLGALDPIVRAQLQEDLVPALAGLTAILVTHDIAEAARLADRVAVMQGGLVVQHDTMSRIVRAPASPFVEEFFRAQRPPAALLPDGAP